MAESLQHGTPIVDPTPDRQRRLVRILQDFLNNKVSLAELRGMSRQKLFRLAEIGHIKFKYGRIDEAERIFEALLILDHRNAYFHAVMAAIHQKKGRIVQSVVEYSKSLKMNPKDVASFVNRGEIFLRNKDYRRAAEDLRSAILLDTSGRNLWANRARSLVIALKRNIERQAH